MSSERKNSAKVEDGEKNKVDLDTILVEELGQFGFFQARALILGMIVAIFAAWAATEYIFTTARIPSRCYINECDGEDPAFITDWLLNAIPGTAPTSSNFDQCNRFGSVNTTASSADGVCPAQWFDRNQQKPCERHLYENTNTIVYDYDLACDDWRRSMIGSIRTMGVLAAMPITGFVSDRWGRRTALTINCVNTAWLGILRVLASTYVGFNISQFAEAMFGSGSFSSIYILIMEVVGPKYRVAAGATLNCFFSVGQMLMGLIAWGLNDWRHLTLALYSPMLLTISFFWIMTESVRWYMSKGRYKDSERVLKTVARVNGKTLSEKSLEALRVTAEKEKEDQAKIEEEKKNEPWLIVLVFRHKEILLRCCISPVWWITTTFIYYGLSINAVNMSGNRYINYIAVSSAQIPGYWIAVLLLSRIGRKPVLITSFWLCAACQLGYVFLPDDQYALSLTMYLIGTCCIAATMTSIYVYTAELYPTKYRHSLFAFSSMMGRIGSILAPLTPALGLAVWEELPFVLFGSFALLSGALVFITPETAGKKFPDTMEEASELSNKKVVS